MFDNYVLALADKMEDKRKRALGRLGIPIKMHYRL